MMKQFQPINSTVPRPSSVGRLRLVALRPPVGFQRERSQSICNPVSATRTKPTLGQLSAKSFKIYRNDLPLSTITFSNGDDLPEASYYRTDSQKQQSLEHAQTRANSHYLAKKFKPQKSTESFSNNNPETMKDFQ